MPEINPPLFQDVDLAYSGDELGLPYRDLVREGVVGYTDLTVAQRAAGANMSVDISAGAAWIQGDDDLNAQPTYRVRSNGVVNLAITAADATNPRVDRVIAEVLDAGFSGTQRLWRLRVVNGVATAGATLANLTGAAAIPNNALLLANVLVPAASVTVVTANIDTAGIRRQPASLNLRQQYARAGVTSSTSIAANSGGYTQLPLTGQDDPWGVISGNQINLTQGAWLLIGHITWATVALSGSRRCAILVGGVQTEEEVDQGLITNATSPQQNQTVVVEATIGAGGSNCTLWAYNENTGPTAISVIGGRLTAVRIGA